MYKNYYGNIETTHKGSKMKIYNSIDVWIPWSCRL